MRPERSVPACRARRRRARGWGHVENVVWREEIQPGLLAAVKCWIFAAWAEGPCARGTTPAPGVIGSGPVVVLTPKGAPGKAPGAASPQHTPPRAHPGEHKRLRAPTAELRGAGLQNPGGCTSESGHGGGGQQHPGVPPGISTHRATGTGDSATALGWLSPATEPQRLAAAVSG